MPTRTSNGWSPANVLRTAAIVVGLYVALRLFWTAHEVFFLAFIGVFFGLTLSSAADRLQRSGIPRAVAHRSSSSWCSRRSLAWYSLPRRR